MTWRSFLELERRRLTSWSPVLSLKAAEFKAWLREEKGKVSGTDSRIFYLISDL